MRRGTSDHMSNGFSRVKPRKMRRDQATAPRAEELLRRDSRALGERLELRPLDRRVHALEEGALREAAVGAAHHALAADELREPDEPVGDELRMLDDVRVVRDDARDEHLPLGQLDVLPEAPLVLVARVRLLDQVVAGAHPEHEVDDVGERGVVGVRAVPAAEADVVADALLRDALERMVERLDPQLRPAPVVLDRAAEREDRVVLVQQHRVVDLEQEAGVDDAPVLLVQRVGDGEDELLLARVVLVAQPVDAGRSDDGEEGVGDVDARERALEAGDVALERGGVVVDRPGAEPELPSGSISAAPERSACQLGDRTWFSTSRAKAASCSA